MIDVVVKDESGKIFMIDLDKVVVKFFVDVLFEMVYWVVL